jgi:hypothetical protein
MRQVIAVTATTALNRRAFLTTAAGAALAAALPVDGWAAEQLIGSLIALASTYPPVSKRIAVISHALLGHRYQANTLIGGPRQQEVFVARDDRFDCVTFCETVLAAAKANDLPSFEAELRAIRYRNGVVEWRERNHDFAAWCVRNTENGQCRPVVLGQPVMVKKAIDVPSALGHRDYTIAAIPSAALLADKRKLQDGDIIGFVSRRPALDYFHTGFAMSGAGSELLLRHASESHGRVVDEPVQRFLAVNGTRYVTVLRPQDGA